MLNKRSKVLIKDKIKNSVLIKHKYINIINKSLFHNRYFTNKQRLFFFYYLNSTSLIAKKLKNICTLSGESKAVNRKLLLTRFRINENSVKNKLQNFKIKSW